MKAQNTLPSPRRITDLIEQKNIGRAVTCIPEFEILPVDFHHRIIPYKAFIFLCRFSGKIDGREYSFRKCYARGCPEYQCVYVSKAIMVANRYLQQDYFRLVNAGIEVDQRLFALDDMMLKFDFYQQNREASLTLEDCLLSAKDGDQVDLYVDLEYVPAVEHFSDSENSQTFLTADFIVTTVNKQFIFHRCLSCYPTEKEREEKSIGMEVANARLKALYQDLNTYKVDYPLAFFQ